MNSFVLESIPRLETDMKKRVLMQVTLLVVGLAMMGAGVLRGELVEIFQKGILVCLECIGIG